MNTRYVILIHPTCYTSYRLLKRVNEEKLLDKIKLIDVAAYPHIALKYGILSVPAIIIDDKPMYAGPIDLGKAVELLRGNIDSIKKDKVNVDDIVRAIVDSFALSSIVLVHGLNVALNFRETIKASIGIVDNSELNNRIQELLSNTELIAKVHAKAARNVAYNVVRILYWTYGRRLSSLRDLEEFLSLDHLALLLEAFTILGRVGLKHLRRKNIVERTRSVYKYLIENFSTIRSRVFEEQDQIIFDDEYIDLLRGKGVDVRYLEDLRLLFRT